MFRKIIEKIRQVMYRMGLLKGVKNISERTDISINEEMYEYIELWKALYSGFYELWHTVRYYTLEGQKTRRMATLGVAKTASAEMASLIFNEKCEISISDESTAEFVKDVFRHNNFYKKFQDYLEYSFAMGGAVIKPYAENDVVKLSFVTADCFIPISWINETIREAVFVSEFWKNSKKYTHLEWHVWEGEEYVIRNELYESKDGNDLGVQVSLGSLLPDIEPETRIAGLERPLFVYFKPNTANNIDTKSPLGVSIYANALDTMRVLDTAFDSFHREFRLGKKRIIVPSHMVKAVVDPQTGEMRRYFDASDETYEAFNFNAGGMDDDTIKDISVELRVEEHISSINALLNWFAVQIGFSAGTFTFDGTSMKTATEVISEQSKTFKTKQSHEVIIEAALQELVHSIVDVARLYNLFNGTNDFEVSIQFDDSIAEDHTAEVNRAVLLVNNRLLSRKRALMKIHGLTEEEAQEWLDEINEETTIEPERVIDFFGRE